MRARPAWGFRNPSSVWISVDLPAPLGPSSPIAFPVPETPRRQVIPWRISGRPSFTFRLSSSTTGVVSKLLLLSHHLAQVLEQHRVHDQSHHPSTARRMDLFRGSIEHHENWIASRRQLA